MSDLVDVNTNHTIYFKPARSLWFFSIPAMVMSVMFPRFFPETYSFTYNVVMKKIKGVILPFVNVKQWTYRFGKLVSEYSFDIEHDLFLGCFQQSTVRDYETLYNSIFMVVSRGTSNSVRTSWDVNAKLNAIAAVYMFRNGNYYSCINALTRVLCEYIPRLPGWYVIGDTHTPQEIDPPVDVSWKEPARLVDQLYVARLLDNDFANIIFPMNAPARTRAEYEKGFTKRLKKPPRNTYVFNNVTYNRTMSNRVLSSVVKFVMDNFIMPTASKMDFLSDEEVRDKCLKHAKDRFTDPRSVEAYMEGVRIALEELPDSPLVKKMMKGAINLSTFDKKEWYKEQKPIRYIMSPSIKVRGFCHALLMNAQHRMFGEGEFRNPHCVKHMNDAQRRQYVEDLFGTSGVFNTDYSSMEGSVSKDMMQIIEYPVFSALTPKHMQKKLEMLWTAYTKHNYHISCKRFEMDIEPMRLSGQDHTSAGNWIINFVWCVYIIKIITGSYPDPSSFKAIFEGDDGLGTQRIKLEDGRIYMPDPDDWHRAAETVGASLKIGIFDNLDDASFCGIKLTPCFVDGMPVKELEQDPYYVLAKVLYDPSYDKTTLRHDSAKLYARALSWMPRCVGCPELYDALMYLAQKHHPTNEQAKQTWFKNVWIQTFYKGNDDDLSINGKWELMKYCKHMHIPYRFQYTMPDILKHQGPRTNGMELEHVKPKNIGEWALCLDEVKSMLTTMPDLLSSDYSLTFNPRDGWCAHDSMYCYLRDSNQLNLLPQQLSMEEYRAYNVDTYNVDQYLTIESFITILPNGGHVDFIYKGVFYNVSKDADGTIHKRTYRNGERPERAVLLQTPSSLTSMFFVAGHAQYLSKKNPVAEVFGEGNSDTPWKALIVVCFLIFAALYVLCKMSWYKICGVYVIGTFSSILGFISWYCKQKDWPNASKQVMNVFYLIGVYTALRTALLWLIGIAAVLGIMVFFGLSTKDIIYGAFCLVRDAVKRLFNWLSGIVGEGKAAFILVGGACLLMALISVVAWF